MKPIPADYVPPEQEFETFDDGEYMVKGFEWFSITEDTKRPILIAQKNGQMVGRLNFYLEDGEEGPPYSLEVGDMALLVLAFGGDIDKLPEQPSLAEPGRISAYMEAVKKLCSTDKASKAYVKKGWVNWVEGMQVVGFNYFVLEDIGPKDEETEEPVTKEGEWGPYFMLRFRVTAGEGGGATKFKGASFSEIRSYSIVVNEEGEIPEADWERTKVSGQPTKSAVILSRLMEHTAPTMFEEGFVPTNPYNLLPDWLREAKKANRELKGYRAKEEKGNKIKLQWATVEPVQLGVVIAEPEVKPQAPEMVLVDAKAREVLKALLTTLAGGPAFVADTLDVTPLGRETAKKYLGPLKSAGVLSHGVIKSLAFDEVQVVFDRISIPEEYKQEFTVLRQQLAAVGIRVDETEDIF